MALIIPGGKVAGMPGILLAIPPAAMVVIFYKEILSPRTERRIAKVNAEEKETEDGVR